jgi:hypothetical protein
MVFLVCLFSAPSLKASEERQILSPTEVKKRRKRHETQTCVEICVLLDLLWLANRRAASEGSQKSAQKSAAGAALQKSDAAVKPSSADSSAASTAESSLAFAWSLNFAGRLPLPASSSTTTGLGEKSATAVGKTSWRQAAAAAIEAKKNAAAAANATNDSEPDSASTSSRFALIAPTAADACGARVLLALLRVTDAFQVRTLTLSLWIYGQCCLCV